MNLPWLYVGRVSCISGYGEAARHQLWALRKAGVRFRVQDVASMEHIRGLAVSAGADGTGLDALITAAKASDDGVGATVGTIIHLSPNCAVKHLEATPGPHVLVSVWETSRLPPGWARHCNRFDQVWCPTEWQRDVYRKSGVQEDKLRLVTFGLDPDHYPVEGPASFTEGGASERFVFGSVFQWSERKCPRALVGAYFQAFREAEDVVLAIKTYQGHSPKASVQVMLDEIVDSYAFPPDVRRPPIEIVCGHLTRAEMLTFYRGMDCYVSTHRGEGWGLPLHEAMLLGKPVIATDWSAPAEYLRDSTAAPVPGFYPVQHSLEPPHGMGEQPYYTVDQLWAAPSVQDCAVQMRKIYERRPGPARPDPVAYHHLGRMVGRAGEQARECLAELLYYSEER